MYIYITIYIYIDGYIHPERGVLSVRTCMLFALPGRPRHKKLIWLAWYGRGYCSKEDLAKWLFNGSFSALTAWQILL